MDPTEQMPPYLFICWTQQSRCLPTSLSDGPNRADASLRLYLMDPTKQMPPYLFICGKYQISFGNNCIILEQETLDKVQKLTNPKEFYSFIV
jgi:hypothetical protein